MTAPHPPGRYPVLIIGGGPGGLQTGYALKKLGVRCAHISADEGPAGMFRRFPIFERLISWTKPHAVAERGTREYERYDWNSLIADEPENQSLVAHAMDGTSYFPSREEMQSGLAEFAQRTELQVRYGCRWEATDIRDRDFTVTTTDGEYRCGILVVAVGMTRPWKPAIPGIESVPHYVDTRQARHYAGKKVFIIGKRNSGFELADGLLPWAKQIVVASPRPAAISVMTRSIAAARARYMQPYEDHVLAGGNFVIDAAIQRIERTGEGYRVHAQGTTTPGDHVFEVDEVIAATGFDVPLVDLPQLGVKMFAQQRLPAQTAYWESATVPNIYFAGSATQGSVGLKKYGIPGTSASVSGFRYNARVLSRHIAEKHLGVSIPAKRLAAGEIVDHLLSVATRSPELWSQRSYLAHVVELNEAQGIVDKGIEPLAHFVDATGPDAVAIAVETDSQGDIHPAVYVRTGGKVDERLLPSSPFHDYRTVEHAAQLSAVVGHLPT